MMWVAFAVLWTARNVVCKAVPLFQTFYGKTDSERIRLVNPDLFPSVATIRKRTPRDARILLVFALPQSDSSHTNFGVKDYRWVYFRLKYYLVPRTIYFYDAPDKNIEDVVALCRKREIGYYMIYSRGQTPLLRRVG